MSPLTIFGFEPSTPAIRSAILIIRDTGDFSFPDRCPSQLLFSGLKILISPPAESMKPPAITISSFRNTSRLIRIRIGFFTPPSRYANARPFRSIIRTTTLGSRSTLEYSRATESASSFVDRHLAYTGSVTLSKRSRNPSGFRVPLQSNSKLPTTSISTVSP